MYGVALLLSDTLWRFVGWDFFCKKTSRWGGITWLWDGTPRPFNFRAALIGDDRRQKRDGEDDGEGPQATCGRGGHMLHPC